MTANSGFPPLSNPSERPDNGRRPPASSLACQNSPVGTDLGWLPSGECRCRTRPRQSFGSCAANRHVAAPTCLPAVSHAVIRQLCSSRKGTVVERRAGCGTRLTLPLLLAVSALLRMSRSDRLLQPRPLPTSHTVNSCRTASNCSRFANSVFSDFGCSKSEPKLS
jgi:hypothetical protein